VKETIMTEHDKAVEVFADSKHHVQVTPETSVDTSTEQTAVHDPALDYQVDVTEKPHRDDTDVQEALSRETHDGAGEGDVPEADFRSYQAGENVTAYQEENKS
jgi:hypothetical protein